MRKYCFAPSLRFIDIFIVKQYYTTQKRERYGVAAPDAYNSSSADMLNKRAVDVSGLIAGRYPLEQIQRAY